RSRAPAPARGGPATVPSGRPGRAARGSCQLAPAADVGLEFRDGLLRVPAPDRLIDVALPFRDDGPGGARLRVVEAVVAREPPLDLVDDGAPADEEAFVARGLHDEVVEFDVEPREVLEGRGLLAAGEVVLEAGDVAVGEPFRGEAGAHAL